MQLVYDFVRTAWCEVVGQGGMEWVTVVVVCNHAPSLLLTYPPHTLNRVTTNNSSPAIGTKCLSISGMKS